MKPIKLDNIKPGMVLAQDIISPKGQVLAAAGTAVTAQQLLHMQFYGIEIVNIQDEQDFIAAYDMDAPDEFVGETQSWRILNSAEFKEFKKAYDACAAKLENVVEEFLAHQKSLKDPEMIADINSVFKRHSTGLGIMAMLLNIQGIDTSTYKHSVNVAIISRVLGGWLGITDATELDVLTMCGLYHDIGKSLVPNSILTKPDKLTPEEFARMAEHPLLGYHIMEDQELDRRIKLAALQHHERGDGSGYPYGLTKNFINSYSKVVAIADVYDAMTADRCYRAGICPFEVIAQFRRQNPVKYDPNYLTIFLQNIAESYIGSGVLLSDNSRGIISMIKPEALATPLIKMDDGSFIDLEERADLYIRACI